MGDDSQVTDRSMETRADRGAGSPQSQQVSWWPVHEFITALVSHTTNLPTAGTPAWQALDDADPVKLIALALAGSHHVLRVETAQELLAESAKDIAKAVDCTALAQRIRRGHSDLYIPRESE